MLRCPFLEAIACIVALSTIARADEKPLEFEARLHVDRGLAAYKAERYEEAIRELSAAYRIDPRREILYNWAQAERLSGDCAAAVPLYEQFLETQPSRELEKQAKKMIEKCTDARSASESGRRSGPKPERQRAPEPHPEREPQPEPQPESQPQPEPEPEPGPEKADRHWYQDTWGSTLVGVGVVALGLGTTLFLISEQGFEDANQGAVSYPDYDAQWDKARTTRNISIGCFVAGGALVAGGVARWIWVSAGESDGTVMVGGRF